MSTIGCALRAAGCGVLSVRASPSHVCVCVCAHERECARARAHAPVVAARAVRRGPGGRIAVISYHSLEDRRAKRFFRSGNLEGEIKKDFFGHPISPWIEMTRKPISADEEELKQNPRSRSARLRIAERKEDRKTDR